VPYDLCHNSFSDPSWKKIIDKYAELNTRYLEYAADAAYWYSEMTNTGLLSTAAWMCNIPAIIEVQEEKRIYNDRPGRPGPSTGRVDLFFYPDGNHGEWIETKSLVRPLDISQGERKRRVIRGLNKRLGEALESARQCQTTAQRLGGRVVALVFVPFVLNSNYYGQGRRSGPRQERAREACELLQDFSVEKNCSHAAYFNTDHISVCDTNQMRPFGFGIVAHFGPLAEQ